MMKKSDHLQRAEIIQLLEEQLRLKQAALPRHSVRPHQLLEIEALEEELATLKHEQEGDNDL
ncbi:MAG: hypothetical protein JXO49_02975 [Deltaproteobacteria bacterium]|nr:hypothetical protein [Candidatus Anaeroferrophillus wilburensis]MBN2888290.1 hypothetical protein [Deltaproteobacteria bacterium]